MALVLESGTAEGTLVTILLEAGGCRVLDARPVAASTTWDRVLCSGCRSRLGQFMAAVTTVELQPRAWALLSDRESGVAELAAAGWTWAITAEETSGARPRLTSVPPVVEDDVPRRSAT